MIDTTSLGFEEGAVCVEVPHSTTDFTRQRFEHLAGGVPQGYNLNQELAKREKEGWELVAVTESEQGHMLFWKRLYKRGV